LLVFLAAGALSATGGYLMSQAYRNSAAGLVAPFEYTALVLATFWGFAIWGEVPGLLSGAGIVLILASGVMVGAREAWRALRQPATAQPRQP
jgi:drug/metabolite transporter (DMT)-like permease